MEIPKYHAIPIFFMMVTRIVNRRNPLIAVGSETTATKDAVFVHISWLLVMHNSAFSLAPAPWQFVYT